MPAKNSAAFDLSSLSDVSDLIGGALGRHDVPCPLCGPSCCSPANQRRRVLRIWYQDRTFATFHCARCGIGGYSRDTTVGRFNPESCDSAAKARELQKSQVLDSERKARRLWTKRKVIEGSAAQKYLRRCRGYDGLLPATLGFLPANRDYPPAMIAAFGVATETAPGELAICDTAVRGVHLTKLRSDGLGKAGTGVDKLTIGMGHNSPICLAPINDGLALALTEGIEDALSVHKATGWALGRPVRPEGFPDSPIMSRTTSRR
jgi:hypothetical protein